VEWLKFLGELWPSDPNSIEAMQELFGLLLTADTSRQKAFLIVGPKRSGKGTIARVLTALLGKENVAGPTLSGLSQNFGLWPLIGKPLAVISDARLGGRADIHVITERILSITGEDSLTIDRKNLVPWTGQLPTRFMILTNELPRLSDSSGALASRFIIWRLSRSFYGNEDLTLTSKLLAERPSILAWAMDGRDRLTKRGHFVQPQSARQAVNELADLASPIGAFLRDRCNVGPGYAVEVEVLFAAWTAWCGEQHRDRPGTVQIFGRDLRAAVPGLDTTHPRDATTGDRVRYYQGVGLIPRPEAASKGGNADDTGQDPSQPPPGRFPDDGNWQDDGSTPAW
jgi:putative DNA primase/helicase